MIKSRRMRWADGSMRNVHRLLVVKTKVKRPLGRPRRRWMNNIKIDLAEVEWDGVDWIGLDQDRY
jgi:hypothetical protein